MQIWAQICIFIEDSAWGDLRIFFAPVVMVMTFGLEDVCKLGDRFVKIWKIWNLLTILLKKIYLFKKKAEIFQKFKIWQFC